MDSTAISSFLRATQRRVRLEIGVRVSALTIAILVVVAMGLALGALAVGPAGFWPGLTTGVLLLVTLSGAVVAWWMRRQRARTDADVARLVGQRYPAVASDLLSAVELDDSARAGNVIEPRLASATLTQAFLHDVSAAVAPLDPRALIPFHRATRAVALAATLTLAALVCTVAGPSHVRRGFALLARRPTLFEGAAISREPLVGDVRITYESPAYTKQGPRTVEGTSGDIVAIKGTRVTLTMRPLRLSRHALLLLGAEGDGGTLAATLDNGLMKTTFTLGEASQYRVWLAPYFGRPVREERAHRIDVEPDRPPQVEVLSAADRLVLPAPRPVEVAFTASDDFGLGAIDLVYRVEDLPERRIRLHEGAGARTAQGKTLFDPALGPLPPGAQITYRIEAMDRDEVSGAKIGASRTLTIVIENPRENLDERLGKQKELLDRMMESLADRLEIQETARAGEGGRHAPATTTTTTTTVAPIDRWTNAHETDQSHVATMGRLIDEERRAGTAGKSLLNTLSTIADRLGKSLKDETSLLASARAKTNATSLAAPVFGKLTAHGARHVGIIEDAALSLDDLIGRQRLDDLAAMGRELASAYKRLEDLLARYNATHDEALRRQLERELRDLKARISELGQKIGELQARNDVPTEWQNMPDLRDAAEKARRLDEQLSKGDAKSMAEALAELGKALASVENMLGKNAGDFADARFPQEARATAEMVKKIGDLEGDERGLAGDTGTLSAELEEEAKRRAGEELGKTLAELKEKAQALAGKVNEPAPRSLGESSQDDLGRVREGAARLRRLLDDQDLGEARAEAEQAAARLDKIERAGKRQATRSSSASAASLEQFGGAMDSAASDARDIAKKLSDLVPHEGSMASSAQKQRGQALGERQGSIAQRTRDLAEDAAKQAGEASGLERAEGELKAAAEEMGKAESHLGKGNAREATGSERDAAQRLAQLRDSLQGHQNGSSHGRDKDPVRIPGADDSHAPREWRQELMEAMREKAPERFREEVRRYYEELVK